MSKRVSFKASQFNSKLTDFDALKDFVVNNSVKNVPQTIKEKPKSDDLVLGSF